MIFTEQPRGTELTWRMLFGGHRGCPGTGALHRRGERAELRPSRAVPGDVIARGPPRDEREPERIPFLPDGGPNGVRYAKAFFDLQVQFARKVTLLSGLPLARALLEYTNLYIRFGAGPRVRSHPSGLAGVRGRSGGRGRSLRVDLSLLLDARGGDGGAGHGGDPWLLFLLSARG
mgnify:CR=1 FL=1